MLLLVYNMFNICLHYNSTSSFTYLYYNNFLAISGINTVKRFIFYSTQIYKYEIFVCAIRKIMMIILKFYFLNSNNYNLFNNSK